MTLSTDDRPAKARPDDLNTLTFRQAGATVALHTSSAAAVRAARDTFYAYRLDHAADPAWHVTVDTRQPAPTQPEPLVSASTACEIGPRLTAYRRDDQWWIPDLDSLVHLDQRARHLTVRCPESAAPHWSVRLVRQLMTGQLLTDGAVYAHAAAFTTTAGKGVAVAGRKGQGKTTTLLAALRHLGANYFSNDRILLHRADPGVAAEAWPQRVHVGVGTLSAFPDLVDLVPAHLRAFAGADLWGYPHKVIIEPPAFSRLLSGGMVAGSCAVNMLVWPCLTAGRRDAAAELVPPGEVRDTLVATRMFMVDPAGGYAAHINHWLGTASSTDRDVRDIADRIATTTPCFRLYGGTSPVAIATVLSELLAMG